MITAQKFVRANLVKQIRRSFLKFGELLELGILTKLHGDLVQFL